MVRVKSGNTGPEIVVRRLVHRLGYRLMRHADRDRGDSTYICVTPSSRRIRVVTRTGLSSSLVVAEHANA